MEGGVFLSQFYLLVFFNYAHFDLKQFLKTDLQVSLLEIFRLIITYVLKQFFGLNMSFVRVLAILGIGETQK